MNDILNLPRSEWFDGKKFVPNHTGAYIRKSRDLGHDIVSYWDGKFWRDGFWCSPTHWGIFGSPSFDQSAKFQGLKDDRR